MFSQVSRHLGRRVVSRARLQQHRSLAQMPVPQSAKAQPFAGHPIREGWESTMLTWYASSFALLVAVLGFAPNNTIETWASEEARSRLDLGQSVSFGQHANKKAAVKSGVVSEEAQVQAWDKFSNKSMRWMEDDDDDEDEEEEDDEDEDEEEETLDEGIVRAKGFVIVQASAGPGIWRRIRNLFSRLPQVQDEPIKAGGDDEEDW